MLVFLVTYTFPDNAKSDCNGIYTALNSLLFIAYLRPSFFAALRIYAIWGRNLPLGLLIFTLSSTTGAAYLYESIRSTYTYESWPIDACVQVSDVPAREYRIDAKLQQLDDRGRVSHRNPGPAEDLQPVAPSQNGGHPPLRDDLPPPGRGPVLHRHPRDGDPAEPQASERGPVRCHRRAERHAAPRPHQPLHHQPALAWRRGPRAVAPARGRADGALLRCAFPAVPRAVVPREHRRRLVIRRGRRRGRVRGGGSSTGGGSAAVDRGRFFSAATGRFWGEHVECLKLVKLRIYIYHGKINVRRPHFSALRDCVRPVCLSPSSS
ncbi:hypothetical protein PsYK624_065900 [Phanerochaete sordida]|uniref:Uncharacterized protein n=1 Tax=Phanerochaete sordida TaxID=48140 RepID=A0A9P3GAR6_9APHY|nr:hypothetical protein PsYK624_065900 [Phanerochaete sordida]